MNLFSAVVAKRRTTVVSGGAAHSRSITVDHTKVPATQTDFPVLVSLTDATLKTIASGGHVQRSDGFDIGFYSDAGITTKLKWEIESYDGVNGVLVAWVKIASLSNASDTVFYMGYGDSAITTNQSDPANTWSNGYLGVYHLGNGTTLSVNSSTGSNNGTNSGASAAAGQIDGCGTFAAADPDHIDLGTGMNPTTSSTLSAWAKATTLPSAYNGVLVRNLASPVSFNTIYVKSTGKVSTFWSVIGGQLGVDGSGAATISTGTWYYLASTYTTAGGVGGIQYVNAAVQGSNSSGNTLESTAASTWIGGDPTQSFNWNGQIDEVHFCSAARSAAWITTEYNNQSSPGTFITMGSEV